MIIKEQVYSFFCENAKNVQDLVDLSRMKGMRRRRTKEVSNGKINIAQQSLPEGRERVGEDTEPLGSLWILLMLTVELMMVGCQAASSCGWSGSAATAGFSSSTSCSSCSIRSVLHSETGKDFDQCFRTQILARRFRTLWRAMKNGEKATNFCIFIFCSIDEEMGTAGRRWRKSWKRNRPIIFPQQKKKRMARPMYQCKQQSQCIR